LNTLTLVLTISIILISLAVGTVDVKSFGGSTSILNPATAIATVVAFVLLVLYDKDSGRLHRELLKASLIAATFLDALKIISLATGILMPNNLKLSLFWFGAGFIERKKIWLFATQPFTIGPKPYVAKSLALDPVPFILLGYYFFVARKR